MVGRRVAAELLRSGACESIVLGARQLERAQHLAGLFGAGSQTLIPLAIDARDSDSVADAARGCDLTLSCAGPGFVTETASVRGAVAAGATYLSINDDADVIQELFGMDADAVAGGAVVISGCGFSPGLTNLLVTIGMGELTAVDEIDISIGASSADPNGPAARMHVLHMLSTRATYLSDGSSATTAAGRMPRPIYLPEPVGWVETVRAGHPEVVTLARRFPNVSAIRYRFGLTERTVMDTARGLGAAGMGRTEKVARLTERLSRPLTPLLEKLPPRGVPWTAGRVDLHGEAAGRRHTVSLGVADHLVNLTAATLVQAALKVMSSPPSPGIHAPEDVLSGAEMTAGLAARGIRVARLEPYPV